MVPRCSATWRAVYRRVIPAKREPSKYRCVASTSCSNGVRTSVSVSMIAMGLRSSFSTNPLTVSLSPDIAVQSGVNWSRSETVALPYSVIPPRRDRAAGLGHPAPCAATLFVDPTRSAPPALENQQSASENCSLPTVQTSLRFERWYLPLAVPVGLGPSRSEIRLDAGVLHVKMGWAFEADIPLASITKAEPVNERVLTWGVHYSAGRWLVNGSGKGLVALTIETTVQA